MYEEPVGYATAGHRRYRRQPSGYERFMQEQNIPIVRGIGVRDVRELGLAPWKRMGGQGCFIHLDRVGARTGMYVVEVPAGGALNAERHIYEENFLIVEGRGTTEVWREGSARKQAFEWQPGSLFSIPVNTWHRLVNATSSPALVLGVTTAPITLNLFPNERFVFDNPFEWTDPYYEREDYFKPREDFEPHPEKGHAFLRTNLIPDVVHCYLPLDNTRGPGFRLFRFRMAGNTNFEGFVAEYPSGRYSKAHYHPSGAVLVCVRGKGYSYTWPKELGARPWEAGKEEFVKMQEYVPGGMIGAAPGGGDWFHQHFSVGKDPLRQVNITGGSRSGVLRVEWSNLDDDIAGVSEEIHEGGYALSYRDEDPHIRKAYQEALKREGVKFEMPDSIYA
ncbi:MAG: cupin domain-containing protein [Deltaproteobacteria bacterium]|nr:cupin domain-containing protein [Deltaproteobacteria bacterium]